MERVFGKTEKYVMDYVLGYFDNTKMRLLTLLRLYELNCYSTSGARGGNGGEGGPGGHPGSDNVLENDRLASKCSTDGLSEGPKGKDGSQGVKGTNGKDG